MFIFKQKISVLKTAASMAHVLKESASATEGGLGWVVRTKTATRSASTMETVWKTEPALARSAGMENCAASVSIKIIRKKLIKVFFQ